MSDTDSIVIAIACNDDLGRLGKASKIQMLGCEFELVSGGALSFHLVPPRPYAIGRFTLAGKEWLFFGWIEYYGNMCWNGYRVSRSTAKDFLLWLHRRKLYEITSGNSEFFDAFGEDVLTEAAVARLFAAVEHNDMPAVQP